MSCLVETSSRIFNAELKIFSDLKSSCINSGINIVFKRRLTGEIYSTLNRNKCLARKAVTLLTLYPTICGTEFKLLTPGIRPTWAANNDQKRIVTPGEAIKLGADYLVIGRPIYGAKDPVAATKKIIAEISEVVS